MTEEKKIYEKLIRAMGVPLSLPLTCVKFYKKNDSIPEEVQAYHTDDITLTSCQAHKQSASGDAVLLTRENIGCVAAAITFGLVDQNDPEPLAGSRVYTDIMKNQAADSTVFRPPSPKDFTEGTVYACREAGVPDFCLFGKEDAGRFKTRAVARKAISEMTAIQPAVTQGVFFYSIELDLDIPPDVAVLVVRPVELTRLLQAWQWGTGERVIGSMGPVRVVNSDLIVRPYLTGRINFSSYCIGARLIARFSPNTLGLGMPWSVFRQMADLMEESAGGYPFHLYPGSDPKDRSYF